MYSNDNLDQNVLDNRSKILNLLVSTFKYLRKPKPEIELESVPAFSIPNIAYSRQHLRKSSPTSAKVNQSLLPTCSKSARKKVPGNHQNSFCSNSGWLTSIIMMTSTRRVIDAFRTRTYVSAIFSPLAGHTNVNHSLCMNPSAQPYQCPDTGWHSFHQNR